MGRMIPTPKLSYNTRLHLNHEFLGSDKYQLVNFPPENLQDYLNFSLTINKTDTDTQGTTELRESHPGYINRMDLVRIIKKPEKPTGNYDSHQIVKMTTLTQWQ